MTVSLVRCLAIVAAVAAIAGAQGPIRGPMMGWVWDARQEALRPILGIAGSSVLGKPADLGFAVKAAVVSGRQEFALVLGGEERAGYVVDLRGAAPVAQRLDDVTGGASSLTLSPKGNSGSLWYADAKRLVVLTGLGTSAVTKAALDLTNEGAPTLTAVSDDGALVLAGFPEGDTLVAIDRDGNRTRLSQPVVARAVTFLEESHDAVFSSADGVWLARSIPAVTELTRIVEGDSFGAVAGLDGRRILVVNTSNATVNEVNVTDLAMRTADCPCTPTGLIRMINGGVFRLNEVSGDPLWLVEVSEAGMRTVFVPPDPAEPGTEG